MKQQIWMGAVLCLVTLIVTYGFNQLTQRIDVSNGRVYIGSPITISGTIYYEMQIENWNSKQLDGLILVVPSSVSLPSITSSFPITIEELKGTSGSSSLKRISFSGIPSHHIARVMIPLSTARDIDDFHLASVEQLNLETQWSDYSQDPTIKDFKRAWFNVIAYTFYVCALWFFWQRYFLSTINKEHAKLKELSDDYDKRIKEGQSTIDKFKVENDQVRNEVRQIKSYYLRVRLVLLARLSDYSKELDFWRDTIRRVLMTEGLDKNRTETIINKKE